jgi:hypothetical protein
MMTSQGIHGLILLQEPPHLLTLALRTLGLVVAMTMRCEVALTICRGAANRVGGGFSPPPPTPPSVRVHTGRFTEDS